MGGVSEGAGVMNALQDCTTPVCGSMKCVMAALLLTGPMMAVTMQQTCMIKCAFLSSLWPSMCSELGDVAMILLYALLLVFNLLLGGFIWALLRGVAERVHGQHGPVLQKGGIYSYVKGREPVSRDGRVIGYKLTKCDVLCNEEYYCSSCDRRILSKIGLISHGMNCSRGKPYPKKRLPTTRCDHRCDHRHTCRCCRDSDSREARRSFLHRLRFK